MILYAALLGAPENLGKANLKKLTNIYCSSADIVGRETTVWTTVSWETTNAGGTSTLGGLTIGFTHASVPLWFVDIAPSDDAPPSNPKILTKASLSTKNK